MSNAKTIFRKCKDCPDRYPGCHGTCEYSIEAHKKVEDEKREIAKKREIDRYEKSKITERWDAKIKYDRAVHRRGRKVY